MNKLLLIVDPQYDFISGTLPVPGAAAAMEALAAHVATHGDSYAAAVVTSDWHPYDHSSFAPQGGPWPRHCVQHSHGAAVFQPLLDAIHAHLPQPTVVYKGDDAAREEYSIFDNARSAAIIARILAEQKISRVEVCGLAGDVCVLNTWLGGRAQHPDVTFAVLEEFSPSLDGGQKLHEAVLQAEA